MNRVDCRADSTITLRLSEWDYYSTVPCAKTARCQDVLGPPSPRACAWRGHRRWSPTSQDGAAPRGKKMTSRGPEVQNVLLSTFHFPLQNHSANCAHAPFKHAMHAILMRWKKKKKSFFFLLLCVPQHHTPHGDSFANRSGRHAGSTSSHAPPCTISAVGEEVEVIVSG